MRSYTKPIEGEVDSGIFYLTMITTVKEASVKFNYSMRTIQQWCDEGRIVAVKIYGQWVLDSGSLQRFVKARERR